MSTAHLSLQPHDVTLVVSHGCGCFDGFAAALAAFAYNPRLKFLMLDPNDLQAPNEEIRKLVEHEAVLCVDIAPTYEVLKTWNTRNFAVLDHHRSAEGFLREVPEANKVFRMDLSGCVMSWHYFFPNTLVPDLFQVVQARDLFLKDRVDHCDEIICALRSVVKFCAVCWSACLYDVTPLLDAGMYLLPDLQLRIQEYVAAARPRVWFNQRSLRAWAVNVTESGCTSDTGCQLVSREGCENDIAVLFRYDTSERLYRVSLRSLQNRGPDVSKLAEQYGGAGHKNAAGFKLRAPIEELFH